MKLLIVVSKLLTGFDAPSCTYIYPTTNCVITTCSKPSAEPTGLTATTRITAISSISRNCSGTCRRPSRFIAQTSWDIDQGGGGDNNVELKDWLVEGQEAARSRPRGFALPLRSGSATARNGAISPLLLRRRHAMRNALAETEPLRISFYKTVAKVRPRLLRYSSEPERGGLLCRRNCGPAKGS